MTDQKAIAILTGLKMMVGTEAKEACDIAISALQERDERSKPIMAWQKYSNDEWICPYCRYDKYCDTLDGGVLPPFCENCGRPLKGADNDRLETVPFLRGKPEEEVVEGLHHG